MRTSFTGRGASSISIRPACLGMTRRPAGSIVVFMADRLPRLFIPESPDQRVGACEQRRRDRESEGLGRLEVDDQLELRGLFDGQIGGPGAFQDLVHIERGAMAEIRNACPVHHEAAHARKLAEPVHGGQPVLAPDLEEVKARRAAPRC